MSFFVSLIARETVARCKAKSRQAAGAAQPLIVEIKRKFEKTMNCEQIKYELSIYLDDEISFAEGERVKSHLESCPLCRSRLEEFRTIKNSLRISRSGAVSPKLLEQIRKSVEIEMIARDHVDCSPKIRPLPETTFLNKLNYWFLPYSLGTIAAAIFLSLIFVGLTVTKDAADEMTVADIVSDTVYLSPADLSETKSFDPNDLSSPGDPPFALEGFAPRINPEGALYSLTNSFSKGEFHDDELVFVANVFGNGLATISQIVDAPQDDHEIDEIEDALNMNPKKAPFLPPTLNQNSKAVKVVVKIQWVDVRGS